jgi:hypothetical protein
MFVKIKNYKQIRRVIIAEYDVSNALKWKNHDFYTHPVLVRLGTGKGYFVETMQRNIIKHCRNTIFLAHNSKSFDCFPILECLINRHSIRPDKIMYNGSKIMYMHISKFLDSLNFLPMKVAKIPDAFGLEELRKGYFPHLFNTRENQTYVGPYPDLHYYGYDYMTTSERKKLAAWNKTKDHEQFHFQEEMLQYCRSDVDILRRGCMAFRSMMIKATTMETRMVHPDGTEETSTTHGVDPFDYVTIASVCMGIFKTLFLNEEKKG